MFEEVGLRPIFKEVRQDGNVSYWFGTEQVADLGSTGVLERIPLAYWAHYMVSGSPPTWHKPQCPFPTHSGVS